MGTNLTKEHSSNQGILPLTINYLFKAIRSDELFDFIVKISFLELYNEDIYDLLNTKMYVNLLM